MNLLQSIKIALDMLRMHKMRAFLTMLGVIIGVMAVTIIVMISQGFQSYMSTQFSKIGARTIFVSFDPWQRMKNQSRGIIEGLKTDDAQYLRERVPCLKTVSPLSQSTAAKVTYGEFSMDSPQVQGQDVDFAAANNQEAEEGRLINAEDVTNRANVALIGNEIRDALFPDKKAIGKYITLPGITLQVVGVMKRQDVMGQNNGKDIAIPLSTFQNKWKGQKNVAVIFCVPKDEYTVKYAMDRVWEQMMIKSGNKRIYRVQSSEAILTVLNGFFGASGALLAGIAALSLLVGGIGIMNIMLVSVTERTREIGLRKAIGARGNSILSQFLIESATLSLVGGLIGMGIAWGMGKALTIMTMQMKWPNEQGLPTPFPILAGLASALFSALIGVMFGLYPAYSASKLDPIVALRRE